MHNKNTFKSFFIFFAIVYFFLLGKYVLVPAGNYGIASGASPEMKVHTVSNFSNFKTKAVAASCAYSPAPGDGGALYTPYFFFETSVAYAQSLIIGSGVGHNDEFTSCTTQINCSGNLVSKAGTSQCGGICQPVDNVCPVCTNGATNYPLCNNQCVLQGSQTQYLSCPSGQSGQITQTRNHSCPSDTWSTWTTTANTCQYNACTNGATNPPTCTTCPTGQSLVAGQCVNNCTNGATNPTACNSCPSGYIYNSGQCVLIASQSPVVVYQNSVQIISGVYYYNNNTAPTPLYTVANPTTNTICEIQRTSNDGVINENRIELYSNKTIWTGQTAKQYPYNEITKVRCAIDSVYLNSTSFIEKTAKIAHPDWGQPCSSLPNACNQSATGTYDENGICSANPPANPVSCNITNNCGQVYSGYSCPSGCTATLGVADLNATCIQSFVLAPNVTIPNGYVDLLWNFGNLTNVNASCNILNVNNPSNPLLIPGLQNLNISTINGRISNIQENMKVELRCSFVNANTGASFGQIVKQQFVKLFRVIEN
jgi:hypothetical protein